MHISFGQPESTSQTTSRSVQPLFHSSLLCVPVVYNGPSLFPLNIVASHGDPDLRLTHGSSGLPESIPKRYLDRFSRFAGLTIMSGRPTDRQTDNGTPSVTVVCIHSRPTSMRLNNNKMWHCSKLFSVILRVGN